VAITRINEFRARDGQTVALRDFLRSVVPNIEAAGGCRSVRLLEATGDDSALFVIIEEWDSIEAHRASADVIPQAQLDAALALLEEPPGGNYFEDASGP